MSSDPAPASGAGEHRSGPGSPPLRSAAERLASFDVEAFPVPVGREEEWRFTPRRRMTRLLEPVSSDHHLKWTTDLPAGVEVVELAADDPLRTSVPAPVDRVAALAYANSGGAIALRVPANAELTSPAVVELRGTSVDELDDGR
jgi:Fe-S cluster assembly protein SufD